MYYVLQNVRSKGALYFSNQKEKCLSNTCLTRFKHYIILYIEIHRINLYHTTPIAAELKSIKLTFDQD